jgi:hypothetical protein
MSNFQQQPYQPAPQNPPKEPMSREARIGWSILVGAALLGLGGVAGAAGGSDPSAVASGPQPTVTVTVPGEPGAEVTVTAPPVTVTKPAPPAKTEAPKPAAVPDTITEDGTYIVGKEIQAGTYAATCDEFGYWARLRNGGDDIIDNNLVADGGRMKVTVRKGEWFETRNCGEWKRVG